LFHQVCFAIGQPATWFPQLCLKAVARQLGPCNFVWKRLPGNLVHATLFESGCPATWAAQLCLDAVARQLGLRNFARTKTAGQPGHIQPDNNLFYRILRFSMSKSAGFSWFVVLHLTGFENLSGVTYFVILIFLNAVRFCER
jgi:hypothetical protein